MVLTGFGTTVSAAFGVQFIRSTSLSATLSSARRRSTVRVIIPAKFIGGTMAAWASSRTGTRQAPAPAEAPAVMRLPGGRPCTRMEPPDGAASTLTASAAGRFVTPLSSLSIRRGAVALDAGSPPTKPLQNEGPAGARLVGPHQLNHEERRGTDDGADKAKAPGHAKPAPAATRLIAGAKARQRRALIFLEPSHRLVAAALRLDLGRLLSRLRSLPGRAIQRRTLGQRARRARAAASGHLLPAYGELPRAPLRPDCDRPIAALAVPFRAAARPVAIHDRTPHVRSTALDAREPALSVRGRRRMFVFGRFVRMHCTLVGWRSPIV